MDKQLDSSDQLFWAWLAGFSDGEACFSISHTGGSGSAYSTRYSIGLRADDWRVLKMARDRTGLGYLRRTPKQHSSPQITWGVYSNAECLVLRDGLAGSIGLMAKKARDFALWSNALDLIFRYGGGTHSPVGEQLAEIKAKLHQMKLFSKEMAEGHEEFNGAGFVPKRAGHPRPVPQLERVERSSRRMAIASKEFWASDAGVESRAARQLRYAKLTQEQIDEIIARVQAGGETRTAIAKDFGISIGLITKFMRGDYLRRDGSLERGEATPLPPVSSPEFWASEAGQRAHKNQALLRGKLTQPQIGELIERFNNGESKHSLATAFGVSRPLVTKFINGNYIHRD